MGGRKIRSHKVINSTQILEIVDDEATTFRSEHIFEIEAISPSRFFERSYHWTGKGTTDEPNIEVVSEVDKWGHPKQKLHGPIIVENTMYTLLIDLGRRLQVGENTSVHFLQQHKDLQNKFQPFLAKGPGLHENELCKLIIELPDKLAENVVFEVYDEVSKRASDIARLQPISAKSGRKRFESEVFTCSSGLCRRIRWGILEQ